METTSDRAKILKGLAQTGWLSVQPAAFQERLAAIGRWTTVPTGRPLYLLGEVPEALLGLGSGLVDISVPVGGEDVLVHRALPGFWVGDGALLSGVPRMVSAVAAAESEVFRIPRAALQRMLAAHPGDWQAFHHLATLNAMLATTKLAETLALAARPRFARVLLRLAAADGAVMATQEELGRLAGMSRAAFRRALADLIAGGAIATGRGRVRIRDRAALEREAMVTPRASPTTP